MQTVYRPAFLPLPRYFNLRRVWIDFYFHNTIPGAPTVQTEFPFLPAFYSSNDNFIELRLKWVAHFISIPCLHFIQSAVFVRSISWLLASNSADSLISANSPFFELLCVWHSYGNRHLWNMFILCEIFSPASVALWPVNGASCDIMSIILFQMKRKELCNPL